MDEFFIEKIDTPIHGNNVNNSFIAPSTIASWMSSSLRSRGVNEMDGGTDLKYNGDDDGFMLVVLRDDVAIAVGTILDQVESEAPIVSKYVDS